MAEKATLPYEFYDLPQDQDKHNRKYVQVGPEKLILMTTFQEIARDIYNLEPRSDDIWITTFPRSGTTVTSELVWLIVNNMNYNEAVRMHLTERVPFLEFDQFFIKSLPRQNILSKLKNATSRRIIRTHLTFNLLHPKLFDTGSKIIYIARNPKDVIVSYYHFHCFTQTIVDFNFKTFFELFLSNSSYWDHVLQGWKNRHKPNYLFLFYEDLNKDSGKVIKKVATFLEKQLTDEEIQKLKEHLDIKNFKKNPAVNNFVPNTMNLHFAGKDGFIREGRVNSWQKYFTKEMNEQIDMLLKKHFDPVGLKFDC